MSGYICTFSKVSKDYGGNSIFRDSWWNQHSLKGYKNQGQYAIISEMLYIHPWLIANV